MWLFHYTQTLLVYCVVSNLALLSYGAKILGIFPVPFKSHFATSSAVMKSLIDAGHEVTIITPFAKEAAKENYSSIIDVSEKNDLQVNSGLFNQYSRMPAYSSLQKITYHIEEPLCELVFNSKEYQNLLFSNNTSFDVIFVVIAQFYKCYLPIAQKLNVPVIGVTTMRSWCHADLNMKNFHHPADVPFEFATSWKFDDFYHRLINVWSYSVVEYFWRFRVIPRLEKFHRDHIDELKPYEGYLDIEPALIFHNGHHTVLPRPHNPNIIEIGGIQVRPAKPLPERIQKFIDEAHHGVILFTFGSFAKVSTLPSDTVRALMQVFGSIPQRVICKFEEPIDNVPENVMLMDWLPQRDILAHPNVKAFISHCGQSGVYEAIYSATPLIACPLMSDQPSNAALLEHLGVAVHLDVDSISPESLSNAINLIINDTRYYDKMQMVSKAFKDRPLSPQQSVVFWTDYVIKYRNVLNLSPPSTKLNWFQYYLLDILFFVIVVFVVIVCSLRFFAKMLIGFLWKKIIFYSNLKSKSA